MTAVATNSSMVSSDLIFWVVTHTAMFGLAAWIAVAAGQSWAWSLLVLVPGIGLLLFGVVVITRRRKAQRAALLRADAEDL